MDDLDQAIQYALEPLTQHGRWELCPHCGMTQHSLGEHECRLTVMEMPGMEIDVRRRAKSYAIE